MILDNANVLTMDESVPRSAALAIAGGRVLGGVDSREDVIASHAHERVDLQGATVVPGFVDSHVHFRAWALAAERVMLADAPTLEGVLDRVRMHVAGRHAHGSASQQAVGRRADGWVLGSGWSEALLTADADLGACLHEAAGGLPAALVSRDGHALWVTPHALEQLGLAPADLDQPGGVVERRGDGSFAGILREQSAWTVRSLLPIDDLDTRVMARAMRRAASRGVTSLHDMDGAAALRAWRELDVERGLSLRVWVHLLADDLEHAVALGIGAGFGSERLTVGGLKLFADGTLASGTALLHEPELARAGDQPRAEVQIIDQRTLREFARRAGAAGLPLLVHAIGDRAVTEVVDALEATQEHWGHLRMRPRIEHAQLARCDDLARCARLGIGICVQPAMLVSDRDEAEARWGDRLDAAYAYATMVEVGCGVLFGSDAPIEDLHPLAALHAAIARDGGAHGLAAARGPWRPEQALAPETALLASTAWPADAVGESGRLGRLTPGHAADLVVLSDDPRSAPVESISVVATMVGGRWTFGAADLA